MKCERLVTSVPLDNDTPEVPKRIGQILVWATEVLTEANALRPRRHVEILLESVLDCDRNQLYMNSSEEITDHQRSAFKDLIKKRIAGIPVQYIVNWAPFYGRKFFVDQGIFIPRFDSELLIERVLEDYGATRRKLNVLDICCGSGVLGLTLSLELISSKVTLVDKSAMALETTRKNARKFDISANVNINDWDALTLPPSAWDGLFDVIVANPPYITEQEYTGLHPDVLREPRGALTDESNGLTFYRYWLENVFPRIIKDGASCYLEISNSIAGDVFSMFKQRFESVSLLKDLNGQKRVIICSANNF